MKIRPYPCLCVGLFLLTGFVSAYSMGQASTPNASCENLKNIRIFETTILSAQMVPAEAFAAPTDVRGGSGPALETQPSMGPAPERGGGRSIPGTRDLPTFCRVIGVAEPAINFEVWLPPTSGDKGWNGKLNGVGNGGLAGSISYRAMMVALARGYATAGTDAGHSNKLGAGASWALGHPELMVDFASRSIHMTARAAKAVIQAYYGKGPAYSYFTGCSCGGDQALSEAQRYPADYEGILSGAPPISRTHMWGGELYSAWVTHRDAASFIPPEKLSMITQAVMETCDSVDGIKDGVLDDPRNCPFDPAKLLCSGAEEPTCLTASQLDSLRKIYEGWKDPSTGKRFWYGYEMGTEKDLSGHIVTPNNTPVEYYRYMALQNPDWDWKTFSFADPQSYAIADDASRRLATILDSNDPDLTAFKRLGGKLIMYHGWLDTSVAPRSTVQYFENVRKAMGGEKATQDFMRLFLAPGMTHCGGGPGPNDFDGLAALEQWVEKGKAPDQIMATHSTGGKVDRSRPLCPYPQVARYRGSGSMDEAANFICTSHKPPK